MLSLSLGKSLYHLSQPLFCSKIWRHQTTMWSRRWDATQIVFLAGSVEAFMWPFFHLMSSPLALRKTLKGGRLFFGLGHLKHNPKLWKVADGREIDSNRDLTMPWFLHSSTHSPLMEPLSSVGHCSWFWEWNNQWSKVLATQELTS